MKSNIRKTINNPYWIFVLAIHSTFLLLKDLYELFKNINIENYYSVMMSFLDFDFWGNISQIITVFILYFVLRTFIKLKRETEIMINGINDGFSIITDNLNDSHRINDLKIRYVDFRLQNKSLDNETYIRNLHNEGFSKEDLEDIGVNENFIKQNRDKLLPRIVIEKYKDFKSELNKHKRENTKNEPNRNKQ